MKLKSSAILISIVLAIIISGAVTATSYLVLMNKDNSSKISLSQVAYYNAYSAIQDGVGKYGKELSENTLRENINSKQAKSGETQEYQIYTTENININNISLGQTVDDSKIGPAEETSPKMFSGEEITYFVKKDQEVDFYWSKLKKSDSETDGNFTLKFLLKSKEREILNENISLNNGFHKNIKGCEDDEFCTLVIRLEDQSRARSADGLFVNYAINPRNNYGNLTNFSIVSVGQVKTKNGVIEKKLIARYDLISKKLINIMEYDCPDCNK